MSRKLQALNVRLTGDAELVRRNVEARLRELEAAPERQVIEGVRLVDGVATNVPHQLGKKPRLVLCSVPRGAVAAGYVNEIRTSSADRSKVIVLQADDYGATVAVDVEVVA